MRLLGDLLGWLAGMGVRTVGVLGVFSIFLRANAIVLHTGNTVVHDGTRGKERPHGLQDRRRVGTEAEESHVGNGGQEEELIAQLTEFARQSRVHAEEWCRY